MLKPVDLRMYGLLLRPWGERDLDAIRRGLADPEFRRWNTINVPSPDEAGARDFLESRTTGWQCGEMASFAVTAPGAGGGAGAVLGHISIGMIDFDAHRSGRVGYWVLPEARGRGVATRALDALSRWAFRDLGLYRLELGHAIGNDASCAVAERCHYRHEGDLRGAMFDITGTPRDVHVHGRLAVDPPPRLSGVTVPGDNTTPHD
ncbi:GNAT family N-acetyltransferase [Streptomyces pactum]|uniref:GNAT family N-acetyltransferase n=1 Tax=Streptomyces pactum TaxID=68249 RepID=A0ABS0NJD6_9ACTN|nr:GNAT family protein [Streptomyces pactum]MBH5335308.1 GNAT family N-acetyltransferase [Streptomyces pactum]